MTRTLPAITALIINLDKSTARLNFQKEQLAQLGVDYERNPAVSTSDIDHATYESLSNDWERKLRPTEVACFLSHKAAWETVINSKQPRLILEDDALLAKTTAELLTRLKSNPLNADVITLETRGRKKLVSKKHLSITQDFHAVRLFQDRTGAAAYILYPSGARKLLHAFEQQGAALADAFIANNYSLVSYQVEPAACIQLDMCEHYHIPSRMQMTSTIATTVADKPVANSAADANAFKWRRLMSQVKMGVRLISTLGFSKRRFIQLNQNHFNQK